VEIKTRRSLSFGPPCMAVDYNKRSRLIRLGQSYLKRYGLDERPCRIDILSVSVDENSRATDIELIKDAFWET
jgi:putative endonuclease